MEKFGISDWNPPSKEIKLSSFEELYKKSVRKKSELD